MSFRPFMASTRHSFERSGKGQPSNRKFHFIRWDTAFNMAVQPLCCAAHGIYLASEGMSRVVETVLASVRTGVDHKPIYGKFAIRVTATDWS
jgi:hypothetical protein